MYRTFVFLFLLDSDDGIGRRFGRILKLLNGWYRDSNLIQQGTHDPYQSQLATSSRSHTSGILPHPRAAAAATTFLLLLQHDSKGSQGGKDRIETVRRPRHGHLAEIKGGATAEADQQNGQIRRQGGVVFQQLAQGVRQGVIALQQLAVMVAALLILVVTLFAVVVVVFSASSSLFFLVAFASFSTIPRRQ